MKDKGTEATRTWVLVESMNTGKWGRGKHCEGETFTQREASVGNGSKRCHVQHYLLEETGGRRERRDPQAEARGEQGRSGTQRLTCPQQEPTDDVCEGAWAKKVSSSH